MVYPVVVVVEADPWRGLDVRAVRRASPTLPLEAQRMHEWFVLIRETVGIRGEERKGRRVLDADLKPLRVGEVAGPGNGWKGHICLSRSDYEVVIAAAGQGGPVTGTSVDNSLVAARWWLVQASG